MPHLAPAEPIRGPFTWDDFVALDEDDARELIDGELLEVEVPRFLHELIVGRLVVLLSAWTQREGGVVLPSGYKIRISARRGLTPDVQLYVRGNGAWRDQAAGLVRGRPDLVIEVLSPSSHRIDRVAKLHGYASIGVPEYWLVDPDARTLEQLVLRDGLFAIAASHADDDLFCPATFDGLALRLTDLWAIPEGQEPGR